MSIAVRLSSHFEKLLVNPSPSKLFLINRILPRMIPFNASTGAKLSHVSSAELSVTLPNKRANHNHLAGIHACAIATIGEMAAGLLLLRNFGLSEYRIILKELNTTYSYQAKKDIVSTARIDEEKRSHTLAELSETGKSEVPMESRIVDVDGNEVATVRSIWQLKSWKLTRVKS